MPRPEKGEGFPGQRIVVLPRSVVANALHHPVTGRCLPTDAGYFPKAAGHWRERPSGADQTILIYCARGAGRVELGNQTTAVTPGDLLVIPRGVAHAYGAEKDPPWTIHWVHAAGELVPALIAELGTSVTRPVLRLGQDARVLALFADVLDALEHGYTPGRLVYAGCALGHLLAALVLRVHEGTTGGREALDGVARTVAFMKEHLDRPLSVAALAAQANLSSSHYTTLFKQRTGFTPIDYFIRLRMHQACQLLDTTDCSVKEIAVRLGYEDPLYFSRLFKAVNDVAPSDYRRLHKG